MTKRLTEKQKKEIVQSFEFGTDITVLSQVFNCTKMTVVRNLKKNLGEFKYKEIFNENKTLKKDYKDSKISEKKLTLSEFAPAEPFFEIAPLDYEIENLPRKELSSVPISEIDFPKVVYMIVDKKIELEIKLLKDFPEWEFLPSIDLKRKAIEIYFDLNIAKRFCNKDQKVIKVPNTDVFNIAAPILKLRGISRIVCPEKLISL